jgi:hypothetical protein
MAQRASPTVQKLGDIDISLNLNATWNKSARNEAIAKTAIHLDGSEGRIRSGGL